MPVSRASSSRSSSAPVDRRRSSRCQKPNAVQAKQVEQSWRCCAAHPRGADEPVRVVEQAPPSFVFDRGELPEGGRMRLGQQSGLERSAISPTVGITAAASGPRALRVVGGQVSGPSKRVLILLSNQVGLVRARRIVLTAEARRPPRWVRKLSSTSTSSRRAVPVEHEHEHVGLARGLLRADREDRHRPRRPRAAARRRAPECARRRAELGVGRFEARRIDHRHHLERVAGQLDIDPLQLCRASTPRRGRQSLAPLERQAAAAAALEDELGLRRVAEAKPGDGARALSVGRRRHLVAQQTR